MGGSFHASPNQGSLICWPTRGITTNTISRSGRSRPPAAASGPWGVRTFGRSTPRGCLPQCLPKGGVFGLDGLTPAARARSRSLPPLPVSRLVLVQRHRLADPRIGKILEISPVISYTRKCDRWPKRVPQDQFSTLHSGLFHLPDSNSFFPNSSFLNSDSLAGSVAKGQRRAKLRGRRAHPGPKEGTRSEGRPVPPAEGRGGRPAAVPRVTDTGERDML